MLYNNQCKYTSALLVPKLETLTTWVKTNNINPAETEGVMAVLNLLESEIKQYKQGGVYDDLFPSEWLPAAIIILDESFSTDNKLISSVGKMVRRKITERYTDKIDFLYTPEAKNIMNQRNIDAIRKVLGIN